MSFRREPDGPSGIPRRTIGKVPIGTFISSPTRSVSEGNAGKSRLRSPSLKRRLSQVRTKGRSQPACRNISLSAARSSPGLGYQPIDLDAAGVGPHLVERDLLSASGKRCHWGYGVCVHDQELDARREDLI